jgi:ABC-type Na+ efflux pump permease subunit
MPKCEEAPSHDKRCTYVNPETNKQCVREKLAQGLCWTHYQQNRRHRPLTPIRQRGGVVLLPGNVRVTAQDAAVLHMRVDDGLARSVYEATRQSIELGVAKWRKAYDEPKLATMEKTAAKLLAEAKTKTKTKTKQA